MGGRIGRRLQKCLGWNQNNLRHGKATKETIREKPHQKTPIRYVNISNRSYPTLPTMVQRWGFCFIFLLNFAPSFPGSVGKPENARKP